MTVSTVDYSLAAWMTTVVVVVVVVVGVEQEEAVLAMDHDRHDGVQDAGLINADEYVE